MTFPYRLSLTLVLALAAAPVHAQGIVWLSDYNAARREAHDKNLPLVIDFSTQNCHWCRQLEATTFRDPAVVKLLCQHFVALRLDGEKDAGLAQALGINAYPTLVFADPNGKVLGKQDGYVKAAEFTQIAQRALASVPPRVDSGLRQAVQVSAPPPPEKLNMDEERTRNAGRLLALARADYQRQQFLGCLERCKALRADYSDLPEGAEAQRLETQIRSDPDVLSAACDTLTDRLGAMYLDMAEALMLKNKPAQAVLCLEWVVQARPGTPQAEAAKTRLTQIKER
jgi:thioredoxin-related protein